MAQTLYPNRATEKVVREQINDELIPLIKHVRNERKTFDSTLLRYYRIWSTERDVSGYHGRSRTYIPTGRRIIENWVQKLKRDLFPTDEWFDVMAERESFMDRTEGIKTLFRYFMNRHVHLRRQMTPFLRQLVTFGTSPVAVAWRTDVRQVPTLQDVMDEQTGEPIPGKSKKVTETVLDYIGPTFRIVDLFAWFIWPTTVQDPNDATVCFEEQLISKQKMMAMASQAINAKDSSLGNLLENVEEVLALMGNSAGKDEKFQNERTRLGAKGFQSRTDAPGKNLKGIDLTQCYWRTQLEGDKEPTLYRVTLAADKVPMLVQQNAFWHGRMPWLAPKFIEVNNEFYGRGIPETFDRMQYFLNDIADQSNDALVWCMNPIAVINAYEVQDPSSIRMRPGAKWLASPDAVKFAEPPKETPVIGFQAVSQMIALMNDVSNSPVLTGIGSGGGRNRGKALQTATAANMVAGDSMAQIRDVVENIEDCLFTPMLRMWHALTLQCLSRPLILRIAGKEGAPLVEKKLTVADIVGDYDFRWLGSTHAQNQSVRGAQMIQFLQIIGQIPPQILAAQNKRINIAEIIKSIWSDGMGLPHVERIVQDIQVLKTMDPRIENELFVAERGEEVQLSPADDDNKHNLVHDRLLGSKIDPQTKLLVTAHMAEHVHAQEQKALAQQQQQMAQGMGLLQQLLAGGAPGAGAGSPASGTANGLGIPAPNNPGRPASTTNEADLMRQMPRGGMT